MKYSKCLKNLNILCHTFFLPKFFFYFFFFMYLFHKIFGGKANSVDPDQEQSDLGLLCLHCHFIR